MTEIAESNEGVALTEYQRGFKAGYAEAMRLMAIMGPSALLVQARDALVEADTQIEYLHAKFKPTGGGMNALARIDMATTAINHFLHGQTLPNGVRSPE